MALAEEIGNPDLFTGRQKDLDYFLKWTDLVAARLSQSHVILARKRRGKTALVQRLFNVLYNRNDSKAIPFYFRVPEGKIAVWNYAGLFFRALMTQYLGFKLRRPELIKKLPLKNEELKELTRDDKVLFNLVEEMQVHVREKNGDEAWLLARWLGETISEEKDERIIQIIDEFQYLSEYVYTDESFTNKHNLALFYQETGSSKISPQIITGSYIGWLSKIVNHMVGRYKHYRLEQLPENEALACVYRYAAVYNQEVTDESAAYLASACDHDPYYIAALFRSSYENDLREPASIRATLDYETTAGSGDIANMWLEYIGAAFKEVNDRLAKKLVLYLAHHDPEMRTRQQMMEDLKLEIGDHELEERLHKLAYADLIRTGSTSNSFEGLGDPVFAMVFRKIYGADIDNIPNEQIRNDIETRLKSLSGRLAHFKGMAAEERVAKKLVFLPQKSIQPASVITGPAEDLVFETFSSAYKHVFQLAEGVHIEADIYCRAKTESGPDLIVEVKDWKKKNHRFFKRHGRGWKIFSFIDRDFAKAIP